MGGAPKARFPLNTGSGGFHASLTALPNFRLARQLSRIDGARPILFFA
jgi:hypothetical protein